MMDTNGRDDRMSALDATTGGAARDHDEAEDSGSTLGILLRAVAEAPTRAKAGIGLNFIVLLLALAISSWDWMTGGKSPDPTQFTGLAVGLAGLFLLTVAWVLHLVSQGAFSCSPASLGARRRFSVKMKMRMAMRSKELDRIFLALPTLAVVASALLAAGIALFAPAVAERPLLLLVIALFGYYLLFGLRMVAHSTRFLYRHAREQAAAAEKARAQATEAELAALQAQMNPHFLFNTLNTVASLIRTDGRAAESTVENLAEVLRRTLDRSDRTIGTVREELDYLDAYLAVEKERWGERLRVEWQISPNTLQLALPPMTLQPLVENALKHGIGPRLEGGMLTVSSRRANGRLSLSVADDGVGFPARFREVTGLGNLRKRLETLYGDRAELRVESEGRGSRVVVEIPAEAERTGSDDADPDRR